MTPTTVRMALRAAAYPQPKARITEPGELRSALRQLWRTAVVLAAVAFALRLAVVHWVQPAAVGWPEPVGLITVLSATLLAAAAPLAGYAHRVRRHARLPRTFLTAPAIRTDGRHTGDTGFGVPTSPWAGAYLIGGAALIAGLVPTGSAGTGHRGPALLAAFIAAAFAIGAWWHVRDPLLMLTPTGLLVRDRWRPGRDLRLSWAVLNADHLPVPAPRARFLELPLRRLTAGLPPAGQPVRIGVAWRWIDPVFLTMTIRHYAEHAADRVAIGSATELARRQVPSQRGAVPAPAENPAEDAGATHRPGPPHG